MLGGSSRALARAVSRNTTKLPTVTTTIKLIASRFASSSKKTPSGPPNSIPRFKSQSVTRRPSAAPSASSPVAAPPAGKTEPPPPPHSQPEVIHSSTLGSSSSASKTTSSPAPSAAKTYHQYILTGAVALIVIVGTITGAQLKADRDRIRRVQEVQELSIDDQVAILREKRAALVAQQEPIKKKLANLRARMEDNERKEQAGSSSS